MYETILEQFFADKQKLAEQLYQEPKKQKPATTSENVVSYEANKVYKGFLQEQARRAAKSKRKPKEDGV